MAEQISGSIAEAPKHHGSLPGTGGIQQPAACSHAQTLSASAARNPVDWGRIGAFLAIFTLAGGVMWEFADVSISVRNLSDDVKELKSESETLLRASAETSVRVTVLERDNAQQTLAMPSTCLAEPKN